MIVFIVLYSRMSVLFRSASVSPLSEVECLPCSAWVGRSFGWKNKEKEKEKKGDEIDIPLDLVGW